VDYEDVDFTTTPTQSAAASAEPAPVNTTAVSQILAARRAQKRNAEAEKERLRDNKTAQQTTLDMPS
jgi:hypothetical protein